MTWLAGSIRWRCVCVQTSCILVCVVCDLVELACELAQLRGGEQGAEAWEAVDLGQALAILAVNE
ncbi:MAG: hypothetical protein E6913_13150 [Enterococcus faecalis]|nr:hypothetical protein [Enterococcus faecalis]